MKLYHIKIDSEDSFESQRLGGVKAGFPLPAEDIREKMAEDMFLSDDEILVHIDYADLRTLKRHGTFKHAIICDIELGNKAWANEFINAIQSQQLPLDTLHAFLMNIIVGDEGMSLSHEVLYELLQFLTTVKCTDNDTEESKLRIIQIVYGLCPTVHHSQNARCEFS